MRVDHWRNMLDITQYLALKGSFGRCALIAFFPGLVLQPEDAVTLFPTAKIPPARNRKIMNIGRDLNMFVSYGVKVSLFGSISNHINM